MAFGPRTEHRQEPGVGRGGRPNGRTTTTHTSPTDLRAIPFDRALTRQ